MITIIIFVLVLHFLGDFVFQNNWMAQNKSKDYLALLSHCTIYMLVLFFGLLCLPEEILTTKQMTQIIPFVSTTFVSHLLIDLVTSKINSILYAAEDKHVFFVSVGLDQLLHTSLLILFLRTFGMI